MPSSRPNCPLRDSRISVGVVLILLLTWSVAGAGGPIRLFFEKSLPGSSLPTRKHTVQKGEWLYRILKDRGLSGSDISTILPLLKRLNPEIPDFDHLRPGQRLILPTLGGPVPPVPLQQLDSLQEQARTDVSSRGEKEYVVRPGDTLGEILQRISGLSPSRVYSEGVSRVRDLNPELTDIDRLYPGQKIRIPTWIKPDRSDESETRSERSTSLSPAQRKRFSLAMLKRAGFTFTPGTSVLFPAPDGGWTPINLTETPVSTTPWGATITFIPGREHETQVKTSSSLPRVPVEDWAPETVLRNLASAFPEHVLLPRSGAVLRTRRSIRTTVEGPNMFTLHAGSRNTTYCFVPVHDGDAGISSLLKSYLAQEDILIFEVALGPSGTVALSDPEPLSRASLYMPQIHAARAGQELADFFGSDPLSDVLRRTAAKPGHELHALIDAGLLVSQNVHLSWTHQGLSVSLTIPAHVLTDRGTRVALLDQSIADRYLMSLVALKGYLCFELVTP
ncbi:MAG TPA: LysM domain-containing protein [Desulfomicrobiaceae bacterium]|nr:LysM domain-containing protein [Desulfomicrobiaceae bacterium]